MANEIHTEGHDAFQKAVEEYKDKTIFALFCGTKNENGESWCPDCVTAEPVIARNLQHAPDDAVLIHCAVGGRSFWKNKENVFRTDSKLKLKSVPTLLQWGTPKRLEEAKCADDNMVKMLFADD